MGWVEIISEKVAFHQPTLTPWFTLILLWGKNVLGEIKWYIYNMPVSEEIYSFILCVKLGMGLFWKFVLAKFA